jgi:hypothetical protein
MTKMCKVWIPDYTPPSLNVLLSQCWQARDKYKKEADLYVKKYVKPCGPFPQLKSLSYEFFFDNKIKRDNDNYCGKYLTDALRYNNVILGDDSKATGPTTLFINYNNPKKKKGTKIIMEVIL